MDATYGYWDARLSSKSPSEQAAARAEARQSDSAEQIENLIDWARTRLAVPAEREWKLISSRRKMRKMLFEIEERGPDHRVRLIGKVSPSRRSAAAFAAIQSVWDAGMRPPAEHTVVRPVGFFRSRNLLIQEKAPGETLRQALRNGHPSPEILGVRAAEWLLTLQGLRIRVGPCESHGKALRRCYRELSRDLRAYKGRLREVCRALDALDQPGRLVPSHGDYHPLNIFLSDDRVTVIDFDTFGGREPEADAAYFLAQSAIMGHLDTGAFASTARLRMAFLDRYCSTRLRLDRRRASLLVALAFVRSLHYELCILRTGATGLVEPWLAAAERCLGDGDVAIG